MEKAVFCDSEKLNICGVLIVIFGGQLEISPINYEWKEAIRAKIIFAGRWATVFATKTTYLPSVSLLYLSKKFATIEWSRT